jgi:HSP20 family molecular chaperone IbpA
VVNENRLTARARRGTNFWERLLTFSDPIETEKVTAKWADRILTVLLPKQTRRPPSHRK